MIVWVIAYRQSYVSREASMKLRLISATILVFLTAAAPSHAESWSSKFKNFTGCSFEQVPNMQPDSMKLVADPANPSSANTVLSFTVTPQKCIDSDCEQQSARSAVKQCQEGNQPKEIWYGWEMYLPANFPHNGQQIRGFQQLVEWKDQNECGTASTAIDAYLGGEFLTWIMQVPTGKKQEQFGGSCDQIKNFALARVDAIVGKWIKFELYAVWSKGSDGRFELYVDGVKRVNYSGPTCVNCDRRNQAAFGNYICCTPNSEKLLPSTVYYRSISSAKRREELIWE
jgi:hypothetical protein